MSSSFERQAFADQLSIETPEQVALHFPVAGLGSRFVALLVDHLLQCSVLLTLLLLTLAVGATTGSHLTARLTDKWFGALAIAGLFVVVWGYFALFEAFWHGQTPGKRLMKLRAIKDSGRQITPFEALARNLLRFVDFLPSMYVAGVLTMLLNKRNKRLGDLAAGTLVIHEQADTQPLLWTGDPFLSPAQTPAPDTAGSVSAEAVVGLRRQDLHLIEAFLARAMDLPLDTRTRMAQRILAEVAARMSSPPPEGYPERALEQIAAQLRSGAGGRR